MTFKPRILAASLAAIMPCGFAVAADAEKSSRLEEVVVTAPMMLEPLVVTTDPKAPRQPVPAHDGADYPQDDSRFFGDPQGRHRRRPCTARHGRFAPEHPARRGADPWRLRQSHGSADRLCVPGILRQDHRSQGAADRPVRAGQFRRHGAVRAHHQALRPARLEIQRQPGSRQFRPQRPGGRYPCRHAGLLRSGHGHPFRRQRL